MRNQSKYLFVYLCVLGTLIFSLIQLANAQQHSEHSSSVQQDSSQFTAPPDAFTQAELEQILAPIALYPDTLLSHILIAATYPLEVVQAARWRASNKDLSEQQVANAIEDKNWDPSVKALVPFHDLLQRLNTDLDWLQNLGQAFLVDEEALLSSVQRLRQQAYRTGNLTNNQYLQVEDRDQQIVIETVQKEIVYVPYYDTRIVYGHWPWQHYQPIYWHRPQYAYYDAGFYWSVGFAIRPSFYFGGFHWHKRHVVADYHFRRHAYRGWEHYRHQHPRVRVTEYPRWAKHSRHHNNRKIRHLTRQQKVAKHTDKTQQYRANKLDKQHYAKTLRPNKAKVQQAERVSNKLNKTHHKNRVAKNTSVSKQPVTNKKRQLDPRRLQQRADKIRHNNSQSTHSIAQAVKPSSPPQLKIARHNKQAFQTRKYSSSPKQARQKANRADHDGRVSKSKTRQKH